MCGFFAILQTAPFVDCGAASAALATITHRGPDAGGEWVEEGIFLGHRRLSIIDLATGDQPMHSADGRYVTVFNGEIYNFPELREDLARNEAGFATHSDTEVVLEGYRRWGANVVRHLHGMFAFVIWDRRERRAFAARDRLGIKPLCWTMHRGALILSSTLEPFHALLGKDCQTDLVALRDIMTFDYIPVPRTIFQGVHKLAPGHRLVWQWGGTEPKIERYWSAHCADDKCVAPDEFELEQLIERAIKPTCDLAISRRHVGPDFSGHLRGEPTTK